MNNLINIYPFIMQQINIKMKIVFTLWKLSKTYHIRTYRSTAIIWDLRRFPALNMLLPRRPIPVFSSGKSPFEVRKRWKNDPGWMRMDHVLKDRERKNTISWLIKFHKNDCYQHSNSEIDNNLRQGLYCSSLIKQEVRTKKKVRCNLLRM